MAPLQSPEAAHSESPDPTSHAANIYDTPGNEGEWFDETDDDDMDFEPTTDESEDVEFFEPAEEEPEVDFHGMYPSAWYLYSGIYPANIWSVILLNSLDRRRGRHEQR